MFSHGVMTALFFAVTGMIYDRSHTRQIPELGGMSKIMPFATVGFIIGGLVSMGMPGFSGFVAEFPIFMGVWGRPVAGGGDRQHFHRHHGGLYHAQYPAGLLWRYAGEIGRSYD